MHEDHNDEVTDFDMQDELIGVGEEVAADPSPARFSQRTLALSVAGAVVAIALAVVVWQALAREPQVPLAVSPAMATAAGKAASNAGIPVEWRSGHPWVPASRALDASRAATAAAGQARPAHPTAGAAAEDSVFMSSEAARAKRLSATMSAIEQMIESQSGVRSARVVLAEATRPGAPGTAYSGPSAAVTVTMTGPEMSQDLVDAVAAIVSGSLPGLSPERVAVIDANANRQRTARTAGERQIAQERHERERELADRIRTALPAVSTVRVTLEGGANAHAPQRAHAVVVLANSHAHQVIAANTALPPDIVWATEEARVTTLAESLLPRGSDGEPATVTVTLGQWGTAEVQGANEAGGAHESRESLETHDSQGVRVERTPPTFAAGEALAAAIERESMSPLGPGTTATGAWDAGTLGLLVLALCAVASAVVFANRRNANRAVPALAGMERHVASDAYQPLPSGRAHGGHGGHGGHGSHEIADAHDASESVRAEPSQAVVVVRGWLDAGYDARAAHLVVALDSGAAGALLRAMPAHVVQRITVALAALRTPTVDELRESTDALAEELAMLRDPALLDAAHGGLHGGAHDHRHVEDRV